MCLHKSGMKTNIPKDYSEICIKVFRKAGKYLKPASYTHKGIFRKVAYPTYIDKDNGTIWTTGDIKDVRLEYRTGFHAFRYGTDITSYNIDHHTTVSRVVVLSDITAIGYQDDNPRERVVVGRTMYIVPPEDEAVFLRLAQCQKTIRPGPYKPN